MVVKVATKLARPWDTFNLEKQINARPEQMSWCCCLNSRLALLQLLIAVVKRIWLYCFAFFAN